MIVGLHKSFINYGPNKRRSCNRVVSHLQITDFYAFYGETDSPKEKMKEVKVGEMYDDLELEGEVEREMQE